MVGSYLLSGDNAKTYYNKALSIRDDMKKEFLNVFNDYDLIIGPTTTTTAYGLDENLDDPLKSFMDDVLVIPVNMAGQLVLIKVICLLVCILLVNILMRLLFIN